MKDALRLIVAMMIGLALVACKSAPEAQPEPTPDTTPSKPPVETAPAEDANPFFESWETPYGIPPFDRIRDEHYKPAFERGIEELRAEIAVIRDNPEPPSFDNTVKALEEAGRETQAFVYETAARQEVELLDKLKASGIQVNEVDKPAFVAASKNIYADFGKEVAGAKELIDTAVALGK